MFRCFLTGIELKEDDAYTLDVGAARRIIRELKNKAYALEKLVEELGHWDKVEIRNAQGKNIKQNRRRLICRQLAEAFSKTYPGENIFMRWTEWISRKRCKEPEGKK